MVWFRRIFLFLAVNILVMVTVSFLLHLLGLDRAVYSASGLNLEALAGFCLIWGMAGALISLGLSRVMAKMMMGVKVIDPNGAQGAEGDLVRMVHSLARRANLPEMPEVGIYSSPEVNAFATGPTKSRSLVAVSEGLLRSMNREQVEGVLGHEIAHIANGDMVTLTLIQGVVNAFVMFLARVVAFALSQNVKEENRHMVRWLTTMAFEIVLGLLGAMVVAYFSRWREFRADSGGAQFAGRSQMISALQALSRTREMIDPAQPSFQSMKISSRPGGLLALLSTHPPLEERIRRLQQVTL